MLGTLRATALASGPRKSRHSASFSPFWPVATLRPPHGLASVRASFPPKSLSYNEHSEIGKKFTKSVDVNGVSVYIPFSPEHSKKREQRRTKR